MYQYYDFHRQNQKLINDIQTAVNGEYSAILCYTKLAEMAPNQEQSNQIKEILADENRHFMQFFQLYTSLTGNQPQTQIVEDCTENYLEGLESSFKDEQKTSDFYLEIADEATDLMIKQAFKRAAADEQNHAVWFLYFYGKEKN